MFLAVYLAHICGIKIKDTLGIGSRPGPFRRVSGQNFLSWLEFESQL